MSLDLFHIVPETWTRPEHEDEITFTPAAGQHSELMPYEVFQYKVELPLSPETDGKLVPALERELKAQKLATERAKMDFETQLRDMQQRLDAVEKEQAAGGQERLAEERVRADKAKDRITSERSQTQKQVKRMSAQLDGPSDGQAWAGHAPASTAHPTTLKLVLPVDYVGAVIGKGFGEAPYHGRDKLVCGYLDVD
jgi:hypothetical protein